MSSSFGLMSMPLPVCSTKVGQLCDEKRRARRIPIQTDECCITVSKTQGIQEQLLLCCIY